MLLKVANLRAGVRCWRVNGQASSISDTAAAMTTSAMKITA
jgi:hypothetical protein